MNPEEILRARVAPAPRALCREEQFGGMLVAGNLPVLSLNDDAFGAVLIDPPYTEEWARSLYGTDYPRPAHLLKEACRVVKPGGRVGILHFIVPSPPRGMGVHLVKVIGVTTGCDFQIRAFTVYQRPLDQQSLGL